MTNIILMAILLALYTVQSLFCRQYTAYYPGNPNMATPVFSTVSCFFAVAVTVGLACFSFSAGEQFSATFVGFSFSAQPLTVLLGLLNGATLMLYNITLIKSSQTGSYSTLMIFNLSGGIVIPAVVSALAFATPFSLWKGLTVLAILISVYMITYKKGEGQSAVSPVFLLSCFGLALGNGLYGTFLNAQQELTGTGEREEMVILSYLTAGIIGLLWLLFATRGRIMPAVRQTRASLGFLIACSVVVGLAVNLMTIILPYIDVTVFYAIDNAGVMLLSVLVSCIFFREKLSRLNIIGCLIMFLSLIVVTQV